MHIGFHSLLIAFTMWWHNIGKGTDLDTVEILALVGGIAWASGINLYATVFVPWNAVQTRPGLTTRIIIGTG